MQDPTLFNNADVSVVVQSSCVIDSGYHRHLLSLRLSDTLAPFAHGDPIDRRRCQSLLHSRPEPQAPVLPISEWPFPSECQHTPLSRDH